MVLTMVGLVVMALAFLESGTLGLNPVAGAPEPRILATSLSLVPSVAIPNQSIILNGIGFTLASTPGGAGPAGGHQVTGSGNSFVVIAGIQLEPPHVTYPINLDTGGSLTATAWVPVTLATLSPGSQTVTITDDLGVTASTTLTIPARTLTLDPSTSHRGSTVTVTGTGFPTGNPSSPASYPLSLDYAGTAMSVLTADTNGAFTTTFVVPLTALIPSTNSVTVTVMNKPGSSSAGHTLPAASIEAIPALGSTGGFITVSGRNFPPFSPITNLSIGPAPVLPLPAPNTDAIGSFDVPVQVPNLPTGNTTVTAKAGGITTVVLFTIVASGQAPAPTRTPTPTPVPLIPPAVALEPLLTSDNLLRVWTFNNSTKVWSFFDPRPAFADVNTIIGVQSGQVFWINLVFDQTVILNGRIRNLSSGWNTVSW
jgi:hypothetical protein